MHWGYNARCFFFSSAPVRRVVLEHAPYGVIGIHHLSCMCMSLLNAVCFEKGNCDITNSTSSSKYFNDSMVCRVLKMSTNLERDLWKEAVTYLKMSRSHRMWIEPHLNVNSIWSFRKSLVSSLPYISDARAVACYSRRHVNVTLIRKKSFHTISWS